MPAKAENIARISNNVSFSCNQQKPISAVVKRFELNTTWKIPIGMNFWALITVNKPRVLAKLLVKTTFRSLLGMEEKRLVLNTNLARTHDIRMLTSA